MGSSYKLSAIFLGRVTLHFVVIIPDEDEDGDLNIFYDGMGKPNNGGEWKPYVQTVKRRQKINTIRKCNDCDVGTVIYIKEIEEQSKKSNDDVGKIIRRLDSVIKPETIPSIERIRKNHSWLFDVPTAASMLATDESTKNTASTLAASKSTEEETDKESNHVPTAASTLATDESTKNTASTLAASKTTEQETDKESNHVPTAPSTLATDKSTKKTASTLAASKSTEEETDKVPTKAVSPTDRAGCIHVSYSPTYL
eukprot:scaffold47997_cov34-Cyclotella_meneghiniana.AAC.2